MVCYQTLRAKQHPANKGCRVMKEKIIQPKSQEAKTARYLWHFSHPRFDHKAWWKEAEASIPIQAAVWEIMRRHPDTENLGKRLTFFSSDVQTFLATCYHLAWPSLAESEQRVWRRALSELPPRHGLIESIAGDVSVIGRPNDPEFAELQTLAKQFYEADETGCPKLDYAALKRAKRIWETIYSDAAFESVCLGQVLIGFDPSRPDAEKRAVKKVQEVVKLWRAHLKTGTGGKAHIAQWLDIIERFERQEQQRGRNKRDDQVFARYRRTINNFTLSS